LHCAHEFDEMIVENSLKIGSSHNDNEYTLIIHLFLSIYRNKSIIIIIAIQ
jgi:hypothetical protein